MFCIKDYLRRRSARHLVVCELSDEDQFTIDLARRGMLLRHQEHTNAPILPPRDDSDQVPVESVLWALSHGEGTSDGAPAYIPAVLSADDRDFVQDWIDWADSFYLDGGSEYMRAVKRGETRNINEFSEKVAIKNRERKRLSAARAKIAEKEEFSASTGIPPASVNAWSSEETVVSQPPPDGRGPDVEAPLPVDEEDHHGGDDEERPARKASRSEHTKAVARKVGRGLRAMLARVGEEIETFVINFRESSI